MAAAEAAARAIADRPKMAWTRKTRKSDGVPVAAATAVVAASTGKRHSGQRASFAAAGEESTIASCQFSVGHEEDAVK